MKKIAGYLLLLFFPASFLKAQTAKVVPQTGKEVLLMGHRCLTFNSVIRVNQIEVARDKNVGHDERSLHTPERVENFRKAIAKGFPGAKVTWALSWLALHDTTANYRQIRKIVAGYHYQYGDEVTFIPGAYFANAYNSTDQVNKDLHEGLRSVTEMVGHGYRPLSIVAGFLSSANQEYLAKEEGILVCQPNIRSQYSIDNQDGDGAVSYRPAKEPQSGSTRNWSLLGEINQKGIRAQDRPVAVSDLPTEDKTLIQKHYFAVTK